MNKNNNYICLDDDVIEAEDISSDNSWMEEEKDESDKPLTNKTMNELGNNQNGVANHNKNS